MKLFLEILAYLAAVAAVMLAFAWEEWRKGR
jgi:hypothetical protein